MMLPSLLLLVPLLLGACENQWFGERPDPLPGTRQPVLPPLPELVPNPALAPQPISLPAGVVADSPLPGGNSVNNPPVGVLADAPAQLWQASLGSSSDAAASILARPLLVEGMVYAMDAAGQIRAFTATTGERRWQQDTAPDNAAAQTAGGLAYADGMLYASTGHGELLALDAVDGAIYWRVNLGRPLRAAPLPVGSQIYVVTSDNRLLALAAQDGSQRWAHNGINERAAILGAPCPAVAGETIFAAFSSGELVALRAQNGRLAWADSLVTARRGADIAALADIRGLPVLVDGRLYAISHAGRLAALDARSGSSAWELPLGGTNTPLIAGEWLFVLDNQQRLYAIAARDGRVAWVAPLPAREDDDEFADPVFWHGPVAAGGRLWLTSSHGRLLGLSPADGREVTRLRLEAGSDVPPVAAGGMLLVVTRDGRLTALR